MNYIEIINDAIQYIESNLYRKLSLVELASRYYISPTYFHRIFRAVTNHTVKSYILKRKLSAAAITLRKTDRNVVDIAFQYGFSSHEQFTRDFIKMFQVTPRRYRKENISVSLVEELDIVERDFKNKNKEIIVDNSWRELKEIKLLGNQLIFNPENLCELEEAIRKGYDFAEEYFVKGTARRLFYVMRRSGGDALRISCFCGIAAEEHIGARSNLEISVIPSSKYAIFRYPEIMGLTFRTVLEDLHKWLTVSEFEFNSNTGIDMFSLHTENNERYLYVPVL